MDPVPFKTTMGVKHVCVVCHNVSGKGGVEVCHCEEDLNGKSWHQRSQLTTRTTTYWTKKPMEKQHRVYVIGFWVTDPIQIFEVWLQLWREKNATILLGWITVTWLSHFSEKCRAFSSKLKLLYFHFWNYWWKKNVHICFLNSRIYYCSIT